MEVVSMRESMFVLNRSHLLAFGVIIACVSFSCNKENPIDGGKPPGDQPVYPQIDAFPAWSPDGKSIIYNHYGITRVDVGGSYTVDPDSAGLWIISDDGKNPHLLLKGDDINACWNPDGRWIAFEVGAQIYKASIDSNGVDTTKIVQLTFAGRNFFPAWSPDGQRIAYDSNVDDPNGANVIWIMKSDGTSNRDISQHGVGEWRMPSWSSDGRLIVYQRYVGSGSPEIFTMDSSGKSPSQLTHDNGFDSYPKFSPDGLKIVFESDANVWIMDSDGTNLRQLTTNGGMQPSWSPDGDKITYIGFTQKQYDPQNNGTVWIMNMDGSNKHQLTQGPGQN